MRNKIFILLTASALVLGGCSTPSVDAEDTNEENVETSSEDGEDQIGDAGEGLESDETATDTDEVSEEGSDDEASDDESLGEEDYSAQIKTEVEEVVSSASSMTDEIEGICELYEKYDNLRMEAETQTEMNVLSENQIVVWQTEAESILDRIKEADEAQYNDTFEMYTDWEKHVGEISSKMAYEYEGGSIQGMIITTYCAERYRKEAVVLAEKLAEIKGESDFEAPDFGPVGFYGSYDDLENCVIFTEGMESGSYSVLICANGEEIHGYATETDDPTLFDFASDDDSVTGSLSFKNGAAVQIKESTVDSLPAGGAMIFDGAY